MSLHPEVESLSSWLSLTLASAIQTASLWSDHRVTPYHFVITKRRRPTQPGSLDWSKLIRWPESWKNETWRDPLTPDPMDPASIPCQIQFYVSWKNPEWSVVLLCGRWFHSEVRLTVELSPYMYWKLWFTRPHAHYCGRTGT